MENVRSVQSLELKGLDINSGRVIFTDLSRAYNISFIATETDWQTLISFYDGNPLAFEVTAREILKQFEGNLSKFLQQDLRVFDKIRNLLDWHFARLSADEKEDLIALFTYGMLLRENVLKLFKDIRLRFGRSLFMGKFKG